MYLFISAIDKQYNMLLMVYIYTIHQNKSDLYKYIFHFCVKNTVSSFWAIFTVIYFFLYFAVVLFIILPIGHVIGGTS